MSMELCCPAQNLEGFERRWTEKESSSLPKRSNHTKDFGAMARWRKVCLPLPATTRWTERLWQHGGVSSDRRAGRLKALELGKNHSSKISLEKPSEQILDLMP